MSNHTSPIQDVLGTVGGSIFSGAIIGIAALIGLLFVVGFILFIRHKRKFDITVEVLSERTGGFLTTYYDKGAILTDKGGVKYLRLLKTKVDLPTINFGLTLDKTNKGDVMRYFRKSEEEFIPLTAPIVNKKIIVKQDGTEYVIMKPEMKQVEGDVSWWNVKRKGIHKELFDTENWVMKILPFLPQIIGGIITLFILYVLFDSLPAVLNSVKDLAIELRSFRGIDEKVAAEAITGGLFLWKFKK